MKIDVREALRYLNAQEADDETARRVAEIAAELETAIVPRFLYRDFTLTKTAGGYALREADVPLPGTLAKRMLESCGSAVVLVCTLGARFDAMLRAAQARDMAKAVILDACGSAYAEAGCDAAEKEITARHPGLFLSDRFSPGYGDLPLEIQGRLLAAVDAGRRLGVQATASHLMIPSKTVTALIGLSPTPQRARIRGCAYCGLRDGCAMRKGGKSCVGD